MKVALFFEFTEVGFQLPCRGYVPRISDYEVYLVKIPGPPFLAPWLPSEGCEVKGNILLA